jgi:hypothetical protein
MANLNPQRELADSARQVRPGVSNACLRANGITLGSTAAGRFLQIPYRTYKPSRGEMVPVCDKDGAFFRRRILDPIPGQPKYFQMKGTGVHAYLPEGAYEMIQNAGRFIIAEGEFKALALAEAGFPAVAIGGISNFSSGDQLVPELKLIFDQRTIDYAYFLGDTDTALNPQFACAACHLRDLILAVSPRTQLRLPRMPLANLHCQKGIDDARAAMEPEEFRQYFHRLLESAIVVDPKVVAEDLAYELFEREQPTLKTLVAPSTGKQKTDLLKWLCRLASRCRPSKARQIAHAAADAHLVERLSDFKAEQKRQTERDREHEDAPSEGKPTELFYMPFGSKNYYLRVSADNFTLLDRHCAVNHLTAAGWVGRRREDRLSPLENFLTVVERNPIDWAGPIGGRKAGLHEIGSKRVLVTRSPKLVEPKEGNWKTIQAFLAGRLDGLTSDGSTAKALGTEMISQSEVFLSWLSLAAIDLYLDGGRYCPAQALVLAGAKRVGKNVIQQLVTDVLGGRCEAPFEYMEGRTTFNGNLVGAEHWMVADEQVGTRVADREKLKSFIKKFCANQYQSIHAKFKEAVSLDPFRRLTISLNDDAGSLEVLPPLTENFSDKLIILKVAGGPFFGPGTPFPTFQDWRCALTVELPAFVHALLHYDIPELLRDPDYRVLSYTNPRIVEVLAGETPEAEFASLVLHHLLAKREEVWSGSAADLIKALESAASTELLREESHRDPRQVGRYLSALAASQPETFRRAGILHGYQIYQLCSPMARMLELLSEPGQL